MNENLLNGKQGKINLTTKEIRTLQTFWKQKGFAKRLFVT